MIQDYKTLQRITDKEGVPYSTLYTDLIAAMNKKDLEFEEKMAKRRIKRGS